MHTARDLRCDEDLLSTTLLLLSIRNVHISHLYVNSTPMNGNCTTNTVYISLP